MDTLIHCLLLPLYHALASKGLPQQIQTLSPPEAILTQFKLSLIAKRDRPRLGVDEPEPWRIENSNERYQMQVYFPGPRTLLDEPAEKT